MIDVSSVEVVTHWLISGADLHNILRQSYDNAKLQSTYNKHLILRKAQAFS